MSEAPPSSPPVGGASGRARRAGRSSPWRRFWRRYSPRGEFPWSSTASLLLHVSLALLLVLFSGALKPRERTPPAIDVVQIAGDSGAALGAGEGLPAEGPALAESSPPAADSGVDAPPGAMPLETVETSVQPADLPVDSRAPSASELAVEASKAARDASRAAHQARRSLERVKERLKRNLEKQARQSAGSGGDGSGPGGPGDGTGGGNGSGGGSGSGNGDDAGGGNGGKIATDRAARLDRWFLILEESSCQQEVEEYTALGAEIAFPAGSDQYRYFKLPLSDPPQSQLRNLDDETRLAWTWPSTEPAPGFESEPTDATFAQDMAEYLGLAPTSFFVVFFPAELEARMSRLELSYANLREDQIAYTNFRIVQRGPSYDIEVAAQGPR